MRIKDLMDAIAAHVCIEEGTNNDNWSYKKYADGSLEAERLWNIGQVTVGTQVSSTWRRSGELIIPTPSLMVSGTVVADLVGNTSNSATVLEHLTNTKIAIAKETNTTVTLQNVTVVLRTVGARWKTGGGYCIVSSLLSRLTERWWKYEECKDNSDEISRTICDRHIHGRINNSNIRNTRDLFCSANNRHLKARIHTYWCHKCGTKAFVLQTNTHNILVNTVCPLLESANERIFRSCGRCGYNGVVRKGVALEGGCC